MLTLKNITKRYRTGEFVQTALDDVSLSFRKNEFVAILGQSGAGKTTLLNIVGGLDRYDEGDLVINGRSTKEFRPRDWDTYRNNSVGFVFQSYNLIPHLNIMDNVEMGMTLSGTPSRERRRKAFEILEKVGLKDHIHKKPSELSGGQMQRVAIARALANDPDIILADEPTGALDSATSMQIMDLIREIAGDRLVIVVTHNPQISEKYADRVIEFKDGKVLTDSNPPGEGGAAGEYRMKKTSMGFFTALKLSGKNILTKKWRTILTAFASSIGIIGIALVLSLSNGFNKQIESYETGALSNYPVTISSSAVDMDSTEMQNSINGSNSDKDKYPSSAEVRIMKENENSSVHENDITQKYVDYVRGINKNLLDGVEYSRTVDMNILRDKNGKAVKVDTSSVSFSSWPSKSGETDASYLKKYYDVLEGSFPVKKTDMVLVLDEYNDMDEDALQALGFSTSGDSVSFDKIVGREYKAVPNDTYYKNTGTIYTVNGDPSDLSSLYDSSNAVTLKICGVIRIKKNVNISALSSGILYSDQLARDFIADAKDSEVVKAQEDADYNVLTGTAFSSGSSSYQDRSQAQMGLSDTGSGTSGTSSVTKDDVLQTLGAESVPAAIYLYPKNFESKEKILKYLDKWNDGLKKKDKIIYTDMAAIVTELSENIMNGITLVLVAFAAISLVVSLIMISIITYISVLERTREIGVLRALGARKKDISRVFNAETFIIGLCSGLLGIGIARALIFPVNSLLYKWTDLADVAQLNPLHAAALVLLSLALTMLGGFIPAKMAAKKDPVAALRSE